MALVKSVSAGSSRIALANRLTLNSFSSRVSCWGKKGQIKNKYKLKKKLLQDLVGYFPLPNSTTLNVWNVVHKSQSLFSCGLVSLAFLSDSFCCVYFSATKWLETGPLIFLPGHPSHAEMSCHSQARPMEGIRSRDLRFRADQCKGWTLYTTILFQAFISNFTGMIIEATTFVITALFHKHGAWNMAHNKKLCALLNEAGFMSPKNFKIIAFKHKSRRAKLYQAIGKVFPAFQWVLCSTGRLKGR